MQRVILLIIIKIFTLSKHVYLFVLLLAMESISLPRYPVMEGPLLHAVETASSVMTTSTDDAGEYYAMAIAQKLAASEVPNEAVILIPLNTPVDGETVDYTYMAASKVLFIQVHEKPQARMTYGHCLAYSAGTMDIPMGINEVVKFPTPTNFIVAKPRLIQVIREVPGPAVEISLGTGGSKRQCVRPLDLVGEQAEEIEEKQKGTSVWLIDLENVRHATRTKADIPLRERELNFLYRAMDPEKQEFSITNDCSIQPEAYRSMLCEQGDTQGDERHKAFTACGLISRVQRLQLFLSKEKMKMILMGSVLLEGMGEPTLMLEDFVTGEKISNRAAVCPNNNAGIIGALKNLQTVMQIIFSDAFETCLEAFIDNLEGVYRPMELVAADFLRYSVEMTLRRFFRIVRSVRTSAAQPSLATPQKCASFLTAAFDRLTETLSDHPLMMRQEAYYRLKVARRNEVSGGERPENGKKQPVKQAVSVAEVSPDAKKTTTPKTCSAFLGSQLGAVRKDGRPYTCNFGKECSFTHVVIAGKSESKLTDIVATMTPHVREDLMKAIQSRK